MSKRYFLIYALLISTTFFLNDKGFAFEGQSCAPSVTQGGGCGENCTDCHKLDKAEAEKILKMEKFNAKIKNIKMSSVKGLWEVEVEQGERTFIVYLDFAKNYLVQGSFTKISDIGKPQTRPVDLKKIPIADAILMGSKDAKYKIIVFDDPDCPYCRKLHVEIKKVIEKRKDIAFLIKLYPLPIHPEAYDKSKAIVCEKSLKLLDDAMEGKELPKPKCETGAIDANIKLAKELDINGTPAIIFPDGRLLPGYVEAPVLIEMLESSEKKD